MRHVTSTGGLPAIWAFDRDPGAVRAIKANAARARVGAVVRARERHLGDGLDEVICVGVAPRER